MPDTSPPRTTGDGIPDAVRAVRAGHIRAYQVLYLRHREDAYRQARHLARAQADIDDLVADAYTRVLDVLRRDSEIGPADDTAFRSYLLATMRHHAYEQSRAARRIVPHADIPEGNPGAVSADTASPVTDPAIASLDRTLIGAAFRALPERWRTVLWHSAVLGRRPEQIAHLMNLTPNSVAALAYRAREGLRQAYLQHHLTTPAPARCRPTVNRLAAWVRGGLSTRNTSIVHRHLDRCPTCHRLATELRDIAAGLARTPSTTRTEKARAVQPRTPPGQTGQPETK